MSPARLPSHFPSRLGSVRRSCRRRGARTVALAASRSVSWAVALVTCLAACWPLGEVHAQPLGEVVVVPFGSPDVRAALQATGMLEAELAHERAALIPLHDARDRFTARSRPPQTASDSDLDVLAREARQAIEHVAFGRTAAAQKSVREVIARAERTLESLNRETGTARHILDACLSLVRGTLQAGKRDVALEQATRCRRLVPDLVPSETAHPANVVGVLAEADNLLRRMRIGNLTVHSAPESNCSVYLNGRHLGTTPFQLDRAAAGDYRVQVECNRSFARVHLVQLGDQAATLLVDTQFDRAVASDPRLLLHYEDAIAARDQVVSHGVQLGREVRADDVLLISVEGDRAELMRVQVRQKRLVARASVPWTTRHGFARPELERALVALSEARLAPLPGEATPGVSRSAPVAQGNDAPTSAASSGSAVGVESTVDDEAALPSSVPSEATPGAAASDAERAGEQPSETSGVSLRHRRVRRAGYALAATAGATFVVGLAFDLRTQRLQDELSEVVDVDAGSPGQGSLDERALQRRDQLQPAFERGQDLRWVGVGAGALGLLAASLLVEPLQGAYPWWSYTLAAAGLGLVGAGAYEVARSDECVLAASVGPCRRPRDSAARGALLLSAAVPLLSVPLVLLLKRDARADTSDLRSGHRVRSLALVSRPWSSGLQLELVARY